MAVARVRRREQAAFGFQFCCSSRSFRLVCEMLSHLLRSSLLPAVRLEIRGCEFCQSLEAQNVCPSFCSLHSDRPDRRPH